MGRVGKEMSTARQSAYYAGMIITVVGMLLFFSVFVTAARNFGQFDGFESRMRTAAFRAIGGFFLVAGGQLLRALGARGLAGSGVVLDPKRARRELEPYSRMAGGMVKDALDEAEIKPGFAQEKIIVVKCQACGKLNPEDAKFCQECGERI